MAKLFISVKSVWWTLSLTFLYVLLFVKHIVQLHSVRSIPNLSLLSKKEKKINVYIIHINVKCTLSVCVFGVIKTTPNYSIATKLQQSQCCVLCKYHHFLTLEYILYLKSKPLSSCSPYPAPSYSTTASSVRKPLMYSVLLQFTYSGR